MKSLITLAACLVLPSSLVRSAEPTVIDFEAFVSPIIFAGDTQFAYRDPAVTYHDGKITCSTRTAKTESLVRRRQTRTTPSTGQLRTASVRIS